MKKESTMKVQRDMELSEYNRKGILKTLRKVRKPSMAWQRYCYDRQDEGCGGCFSDAGKQDKCRREWMDKHCTYNGASRKARRMK